jgi:hypothetical protein
LPDQPAADAWARERTLGLIRQFPLPIVDERGFPLVVVLATALAAKVSWDLPFTVVPSSAARLPAAPGFAGRALLTREEPPLWQGFLDSPAGPVAAYAVESRGGLVVASAVGASDAPPADVLEAAQSTVTALAAGRRPSRIPLTDLPLGDGPAWRITEAELPAESPEHYECLLPAWEARSEHRLLMRAELGFRAAGSTLLQLLRASECDVEAMQSAVARYSATGFEAAAVTALGARAVSARVVRTQRVRTARIEFTRPHAVVAATAGGEWDGLPVFAAWVTEGV